MFFTRLGNVFVMSFDFLFLYTYSMYMLGFSETGA